MKEKNFFLEGMLVPNAKGKPKFWPLEYLKKWKKIFMVATSPKLTKPRIERIDSDTLILGYDPFLGKIRFTKEIPENLKFLVGKLKSEKTRDKIKEHMLKELEKYTDEDLCNIKEKDVEKIVKGIMDLGKQENMMDQIKKIRSLPYYYELSEREDLGMKEFRLVYENRNEKVWKVLFDKNNNLEYKMEILVKRSHKDVRIEYKFKTKFQMENNILGVLNLYKIKKLLNMRKNAEKVSTMLESNKKSPKIRFQWCVIYIKKEYEGDLERERQMSHKFQVFENWKELLSAYVRMMASPYMEWGYHYQVVGVTLTTYIPIEFHDGLLQAFDSYSTENNYGDTKRSFDDK